MIEYIEAINNPNPQPLSHLPMSFDPKSPTNEKTLEQIHKCWLITKTVMELLEGIQKSGTKCFINLSRVYDGSLMVMKELEVEITNWKEEEEAKWAEKETQI